MFFKRKKFLSIVCLVLVATLVTGLVSTATAVSQSQIDALKQQQASVAAKKKDLASKMNAIESDIADYMEQKAALDEQITLTMQEIELINEQIDLYDKLIKKKAQELVEAKKDEADQKEALRTRMRVMEEHGSMSYISILFKASSFTEFLSLLDDVSEIMKSDKELEEAYIAARKHVEEVKAEYEATQEEQKQKRAELEEKKAELDKQVEKAEAIILALEADYDSYEATYKEIESNELALNTQIYNMIAELERQKEEQRKQQQQNGENTGGSGDSSTGTYTWPLPGYSCCGNYGNRYHPILHYWRFHAGEDISAPSGTPVLAADGGTIVVAAYHSSYGNYIVISHGNGRSTRYAHLSGFAVSAGSSVTQGQTIGYVGSTGLSTGAHLHFETRVNGSAVDPKSYF